MGCGTGMGGGFGAGGGSGAGGHVSQRLSKRVTITQELKGPALGWHFLIWCTHRWVREGAVMNIKSILATLVLEFFDERLCFAKRSG